MLLAFRPGHLVDWADLEQGAAIDWRCGRKRAIYPTSPVQSMGAPGGRGCLAGTGIMSAGGGPSQP